MTNNLYHLDSVNQGSLSRTIRLPTYDNRRKRNVILQDVAYVCPFCLEIEESYSHVLFSCHKLDVVWKTCYG